MRAEYKRDMNHNFLVLHGETEFDTSAYQVRMLVGNTIPSFLKCRFQGVDGKTFLYYEITSKQSLATLYEEKLLRIEDLQLIFGSFVQVMEQMTEYLLNPEQILLQPEYIYMDVEKQMLYFCYLPGEKREIKKQFQTLTEYVLPKIDHGDEQAVMLGYSVYRRALEDNFHLEHVKEELYQKRDSKEEWSGNKKINFQQEQEMIEGNERQSESRLSEELTLEKLFQDEIYEKREENQKNSKRSLREEHRIQKKVQEKIYIWVPVTGTILILAILAANMFGILPWLEVEILLFSIVIAAMVIAVLGYLIGWKKRKEKQKVQDLRWKRKVASAGENLSVHMEKELKQYEEKQEESIGIQKSEYVQKEIFKNTEKNLGKTKAVQEDYGETVILCDNVISGPVSLVSREPGELATIFLKEDMTVIGKLEHAADAVIPLPTISRLHAKIRKRDNEYYLADLNSRNGTFVNGKMLKADEEYLLQNEDAVDFAQARYIFLK